MCLHVATIEGEVIIFDVANVQGNVATIEGEVIIFDVTTVQGNVATIEGKVIIFNVTIVQGNVATLLCGYICYRGTVLSKQHIVRCISTGALSINVAGLEKEDSEAEIIDIEAHWFLQNLQGCYSEFGVQACLTVHRRKPNISFV